MFKKKLELLVLENKELGEENFQILNDSQAFALSGGADNCRRLETCGTYNGDCRRLSSCGTYNVEIA